MDDEKNFCCFGSFMRGSADHRRLFFQGRKKALTDEEILEKVESKMESQVQTAEMGYMTGYQEYAIIQAQGRIFAIMHEDADQFAEMKAYLEGLES